MKLSNDKVGLESHYIDSETADVALGRAASLRASSPMGYQAEAKIADISRVKNRHMMLLLKIDA